MGTMTGSLLLVVLPHRCTRSVTGWGDRVKDWPVTDTLTVLDSKCPVKENTAGTFLLVVQEANAE